MDNKIKRLLFQVPAIVMAGVLTGGLIVGCGESGGSDGANGADGDSAGPIISNISTLGSPIYPGGQVQISVSASSRVDDSLSYTWDIPDNWTGTDNGQSVLVLTAPDAHAEQAQVGVEVSDGTSSRTAHVLLATRGPMIEDFSVTPLPQTGGDEATFSVDAYNRDGNVMHYHYTIGGLLFESRGSEWTWTAPAQGMGGRHLLEATVEDGSGLTANAALETTLEGTTDWAGFGGNLQRTRLNSNPNALGAVGNEIWQFTTGGSVRSSATIGVDGTVYIGSFDSKIHALNPDDGTQKWEFSTDGAGGVFSGPALGADGTLYFGANGNSVYAVNAETGVQKWAFETGNNIASSPALGVDGTVYIGSQDDYLYALHPADGTMLWRFRTGGFIFSSPAVAADGTIYIGSNDHNIYAVNPDGTEKWRFDSNGPDFSSPVVGADGTIYVGSKDNNVYALNPDDGSEKWHFATEGVVESSPAVGADGTVYIGSYDGNLYALNPEDGTEKWRFAAGAVLFSSPAVGADGTVYIGSQNNNVYALNPGDGTVKWDFETGGAVYSSPTVGNDGTIYVGSDDSKVWAIR